MNGLNTALISFLILFVFLLGISFLLIAYINRGKYQNNAQRNRNRLIDKIGADNLKLAVGFAFLAIIAAIVSPRYAWTIINSRVILILILGVIILYLSLVSEQEWKKRYSRKILVAASLFLVGYFLLIPLIPDKNAEKIDQENQERFLAYEQSQAKNHPFQRYDKIKKAYKIEPQNPATISQKIEENRFFISINGNNGYFENPQYPLGHYTGINLKIGQKIKIQYLRGNLTYNHYGHGRNDPVWGGRSFLYLQPGEKIRYKNPYSGHAVFVVLRNGKQEQAEAFQPGEKEKIITNKFLNTVKVYLFYNSKEKWVEDDGSIKDGFVNNGADGSRMVFFVEILEMEK